MDKTLLFIVNPRAGKTKSSAPLFDAVDPDLSLIHI